MRLGEGVRKIERNDGLDPAVSLFKRVAGRIPRGRARDLLNGVQLGHPAHPILVQLPIGAWMSAVLLDLLPGDHRRSAHALVNTGLLATLPAVVSGLADWSQQHARQQRVGVVHAASNAAGSLLFASSSLARARDRQGWGRVLALAGVGAVALGGSLGGHIAYYRAGGANSADHLTDLVPGGWHDLGPLDGFGEGEPVRASLGDVPVVVVRTGDAVRAVLGTCTHMGAPLADGSFADGCLRCPWHGSGFDMDDGSVVHGPATAGLETLETSVTGGTVRVRRLPPDA
ncbi:Rieske 2Fe-2S domain-containing protein [Nocardiopsis sp. CA-288880]|uniref:Rieske 2Fe-2S domain-containing protein n=1 Tax=Nocardiopsis sp. CA-288880 TaxID=3239995 RepID=UPI003D98BD80